MRRIWLASTAVAIVALGCATAGSAPPHGDTTGAVATVAAADDQLGRAVFDTPSRAAVDRARRSHPALREPKATRIVEIYRDAATADVRVRVEGIGYCRWFGAAAEILGGVEQWSSAGAGDGRPCEHE
jgi:hypothetical protein